MAGFFLIGGAASTPASFTAGWQDLRIGAGGQITDISILNQTVAGQAADGTILIRTDTGGAYIYETSGTVTPGYSSNSFATPAWRQLFTTQSVPSAYQNYQNQATDSGVVEIVVCQGNTNIAYAIFRGALFVTTNLKSNNITWVDTGRTTTQTANGSLKPRGPYMYVDPNNGDIIYYSTPSSGVFKSTNGTLGASSTWAAVSAVGTSSTNVGHFFGVDPASSVSGNVTQHFFIATDGTGVYETSDGGTNYNLRSTGGPTTFYHIKCDKFSQLWCVNATTTASVYLTSWTSKSLGSQAATTVSPDPTSSTLGGNKVYCTRDGSGDVISTSDNGANWSGPNFNQTFSASGSQPGWLGTCNQTAGGVSTYLNTSGAATDSSGNLWAAAGISVWTTPSPVAVNATPWSANAVGVEQLVCVRAISPTGVGPVVSMWDRGVVGCSNPDAFPANQFPNAAYSTSISPIQGGWDVDCSGSTVSAWIWSNISGDGAPAYSTDGGYTWTAWAATPASPNYSGAIAVNSSSNWICVPGANRQIYYTTNTGGTWTASTISGSPTDWNTNIGQGFSLAPDRVTAGKFYAVNRQNSPTFFVSTNNGQNFAAASGTGMTDVSPNLAFIKTPPGKADHVWYTVGGNGVLTSRSLWKSTNACGNFSNVNASLDPCYNFGFGATKSGASYPTVYTWAVISGVLGFYQSTDGGSTWSAISVPTNQKVWAQSTMDYLLDISGDAEVYGRIYVTFSGTGAAYIDTADAYPWVKFDPAFVKPGQNFTGTVTLKAQHSGLVPVTSVQFQVDGANIGAAQTGQTTYSVSWNSGSVATGAHTLSVVTVGANGTATSSLAITTS